VCSRPHETFSCATVLTAQVLSGLPAIWKSYGQSPQETRLPESGFRYGRCRLADLIEYRPHIASSFQAQRIAPKAREPYNSPP
jgi:hypothetical protein